jgi:tRNA(fMet)-specific endonuclease VapC
MTYLLDTNAISGLMRTDAQVENWMASLDAADTIVTCTIVRGEILFGISRLPVGTRRSELERIGQQFLDAFQCEPVLVRAADFYSSVKAERQRQGLALDENDLWIAATAMALNATLVSRDGDFVGIDGLAVVTPAIA